MSLNRSGTVSNAHIGIAFASFGVMGFNAGLLGVAWPSIRDMFGISQDAIGALFFASTAGALAISLYSGPIISNIGLGMLLTLGSIVGGVGYLGYALAPTWWAMVLMGIISSVGTAGIIVGLNTFFAMRQSAQRMTWLQACFGLGATVSPIVMARTIEMGYTWRWGYALVVLALAGLAAAFGLTGEGWRLADRGTAGADGVAKGDTAPRVQMHGRDTLGLPLVWLSLALFFTLTGLEGSAAQWPYTLFTEARGVDPGTAGLWISIFWACVTVGRILFGVVVDHIRADHLVRLSMGGAICGAVLIWGNLSDNASFLGLALTGLALAPLFPVLTSNTPERMGSAHAANAIGYQQAAARLGLAAIPALAGVLADALGLEIIGPFLFGASVAMFLLHEATIAQKVRRQARPSS